MEPWRCNSSSGNIIIVYTTEQHHTAMSNYTSAVSCRTKTQNKYTSLRDI